MTDAASYILSLMLSLAPPRDSSNAKWAYLDARETKEAATERYEGIAQAAADVAFDEAEAPLFGGVHGRARTAVLMIAVAYTESGFRKDVDEGKGPKARGSGLDSCLMQVRALNNSLTAEGWTWHELVEDRRKCFRAGLHVIRRSLTSCRQSPQLDQLSGYVSGSCTSPKGILGSHIRMGLALRLWAHHPVTTRDASWLIPVPVEAPKPLVACYAACGRFLGGQGAGE